MTIRAAVLNAAAAIVVVAGASVWAQSGKAGAAARDQQRQAANTERFVGYGQAQTETEAERVARSNSEQQAMARVAETLFRNPDYAGIYGAQAIGDYVSRVGRIVDCGLKPDGASGTGYRATSCFELNKGYLELSAIRQLAVAPEAPEREPWGFFMVPIRSLKIEPTLIRVPVRAGRRDYGSFVFAFSVRRLQSETAMWIRLESIRVIEDGIGAASRWSFDVWANGRLVLPVPERRYDTDVGTYAAPRDRSAEATIRTDNSGYVEFRVLSRLRQ